MLESFLTETYRCRPFHSCVLRLRFHVCCFKFLFAMWDMPLRSLVVELALAVLALHSVIILLLRRHLSSS